MNMSLVIGCLLVGYLIGVAMLGWSLLQSMRMLRGHGQLPAPAGDASTTDWPLLDVVIPVKDEEAHIAACLESILAQDYPNKRILVVNDRSTDGTAAVVDAIRARHPEVRRIDIAELPEGCYGKPHALSVAMRELTGEWVAFVDSDFELRSDCLRTLVQHVRTQWLDWLAIMGRPELTQFWERLLVPLLGAVTYAWYDPRKIADPKWDNAIGSGFLVVRRERYAEIGGHGAVIRAYDEDSAIMRIAKRAGHRIAYVLTPELFTLRLYGTLQRTVRGISRTLIGGLKTLPRFLITINGLNFVSLLPIGILAGLGLAAHFGVAVPHADIWLATSLVHLLLSTALAVVVYRQAGLCRRLALLHPLGSAMMIGICIRAARELMSGRRIVWRGTSYQ